jgi:hypothetical protein
MALQALLDDPSVEEIIVNGPYRVFALKMVLAGALMAGNVTLAVLLKHTPSWQVVSIAGGASVGHSRRTETLVVRRVRGETRAQVDEVKAQGQAIFIVAVANVLDAFAILVTVLVMDYLHLLSHAQALGAS